MAMAQVEPLQAGLQLPIPPRAPIPSTTLERAVRPTTFFKTGVTSSAVVEPLYATFTTQRSELVTTHTQSSSLPSKFFSVLSSYLSCGNKHSCESSGGREDGHIRDKKVSNPDGQAFEDIVNSTEYWTSGSADPGTWTDSERSRREIPQYVLDYAPYVHLFSEENFWPCDIAEHLSHITPRSNYTVIEEMKGNTTLSNLGELNKFGRFTYLTSDDNVEDRPEWLGGSQNIPGNNGFVDKNDPSQIDGYSSAPAVLVVIRKPHGVVDAFWFYFYSYNLGNTVFNVRFGNHVGDWEHTVVRFRHGEPEQVFLSEHAWGEAYSYKALEKIGKRPLTFSATGSHAMYARPGTHPYVLPFGVLHDETDRGPLWDPTLNMYSYTYDLDSQGLLASNRTPKAPTNWFYYGARWGDKSYPMSDSRQYRFAGQYHYVSGPTGPYRKRLGRETVCQGGGRCHIRNWLPPPLELKKGYDANPEDEMEMKDDHFGHGPGPE